jgi:hypothetical protein
MAAVMGWVLFSASPELAVAKGGRVRSVGAEKVAQKKGAQNKKAGKAKKPDKGKKAAPDKKGAGKEKAGKAVDPKEGKESAGEKKSETPTPKNSVLAHPGAEKAKDAIGVKHNDVMTIGADKEKGQAVARKRVVRRRRHRPGEVEEVEEVPVGPALPVGPMTAGPAVVGTVGQPTVVTDPATPVMAEPGAVGTVGQTRVITRGAAKPVSAGEAARHGAGKVEDAAKTKGANAKEAKAPPKPKAAPKRGKGAK